MPWTEEDTKRVLAKINEHIDRVVNRVLSEGNSLITVRDNKLVKVHPDGAVEVLKELPPPHKVPAGTVFKIKKREE